MLSFLRKKFYTLFFTSSEGFYDAIEHKNDESFNEHIKHKSLINHYYASYTPTQLCLIKNRYEYLIKLLETGADPNLTFFCVETQKARKTIILATERINNDSTIKLLALYGASAEEVSVDRLKILIQDKNRIYQQRRVLEQSLAGLNTTEEKIEVCRQLKNLWLAQCENESNPIYREHYQNKADGYQRQINDLSHANSAEQIMLEKPINHTTPLLHKR